jgi:pimeloyl-ACP methyl ester carboxylesterase
MPSFGTAFYLAGDSYPGDLPVEQAVRRAVGGHFAAWRGQDEVLALAGETAFEKTLTHRLATLTRAIGSEDDPASAVLLGRSSGARVATLYAVEQRVRAVICLGYPFQRPDRDRDPARYAHLARLRVPTLIIQGRQDSYSGPDGAGSFPVSDSVTLFQVDCDHRFKGAPDLWDRIGRAVTAFLAGPTAAG